MASLLLWNGIELGEEFMTAFLTPQTVEVRRMRSGSDGI